jgi:hypothetical protein
MKPLPLPLRIAAGLVVTAAERARELPKNLVGLPVTVVSQVLQISMRLQQHATELAIKGDDVLSSLRPVEETPSWATFDEDQPPAGETSAGNNGHRSATVLRDVSEPPRDPWEQEERALAEDHTDGEFDSGNEPENAAEFSGVNGSESGGAAATARKSSRADLRSVGGTRPGGDAEAGDADSSGNVTAGRPDSTALGLGSTAATPGGADAEGRGEAGPEGAGIESAGIIGTAGLANYDDLTLPQLRARLRRFTLVQLEELLAYERAHENRPSFVGMLTRRIGNVQRQAGSDSGTDTPGR